MTLEEVKVKLDEAVKRAKYMEQLVVEMYKLPEVEKARKASRKRKVDAEKEEEIKLMEAKIAKLKGEVADD